NGGGHRRAGAAHRVARTVLELHHRLARQGDPASRRVRRGGDEGELHCGAGGERDRSGSQGSEVRGREGERVTTGRAADREPGEPGGRVPEAVARRDLDRRSDRRAGGRAAGLAGEDEALGGRGRNRERVAGRGEGGAAERGTRLQRVAGTHVRDAQIGERGHTVLRRDGFRARQ